jgi:murein DD-endopeptidase MepM/ murein hydrolase activator NlpD
MPGEHEATGTKCTAVGGRKVNSALVVAVALLSACRGSDEPTAATTPPILTFDQLPDRGAFAGTDNDVDARRTAFDVLDPPELNNPNLLAAAPGSIELEPLDDLVQQLLPALNISVTPSPTYRSPWSSTAGILESLTYVQTDYFSNWPFPEGRTECVAPELMIDCCTYTLTEGEDGSGLATDYYKPLDLYATEASADVALGEIYAQIPVFLPYTDGDVTLSHGWIYNGPARTGHGSMDYSRTGTEEGEDPSFRVRAASWGTVVAKYWDDWHGNVLVLEHPNSGDFEYRSFYFHLRNGKTNDIAQAKANTVATGTASNSRDKYLKFANLANPNDLWWGTDAQAIPVDVGDTVAAHQQIAWSGNTGPGGAGAGLDTNGNPNDSISANNHLHYMLAVRHPTWTGDEWMFVDAQSVYEQQSTGCYDIIENTRFDRLTAPFYPYFHGVDLGVFNAYLYYYGQMGRSPATLSVQQPGDGAIAAGAFKEGLGTSWYVYDYLQLADWETYWQDTVDAGFQLEQRAVTLDTSDVPRHSGVFRPDAGNGWASYATLDLPTYQTTFDDHAADGFDLTEFFGYHDGNTDQVAAVFTPVTGDFIHQGLLDSATFTTLTNDYASDGWLPVDVNVMEMADGTWLSAIYRQTGDGRMVHWGMSPSEYQQWMDFYLGEGWDLEVVQSYAEGTKYAAIWSI